MTDATSRTFETRHPLRRFASTSAMALVLVAAGDFLIFGHVPGINIVLLFASIAAAVTVLSWRRANRRVLSMGLAVFVLGALPLLESLSLLGFLSAVAGLSVLTLAGSARLPRSILDLPSSLTRFATLAPFRLAADFLRTLGTAIGSGLGSLLSREVLAWIVPAVLAVIFLLLFASANPLIEGMLSAISFEGLFGLLDPWRVFLWGLLAWFVWPFLRPRLLRRRKPAQMHGPVLPRRESLIFGRGAILRSLIVFNSLFAVQTIMDIAYLWGGVKLPQGMSYADYAHRGAYPLIVTALLAAGFVLAAMRKDGPAQDSVLIRRLVYLWIAQNVLLVVSSILRLDLYVQVYSLTELRMAAGIWMGLVAVGLVLILLRIFFKQSNKWLVGMNLASLGLTLYVCAFIDFAAIIAQFNVENSRELGGDGQPLDLCYLDALGPSAIPAIAHYLEHAAGKTDEELREFKVLAGNTARDFLARKQDWRSWSFRAWRLAQYLEQQPDFATWAQRAMDGELHR